MAKKLIINADDLGISKGVNRGIIKAHLEGVLNSASLMVNMPQTDDALEALRKAPNLKVGLHLSLIGSMPVAKKENLLYLTDKNGLLPRRGINLIFKVISDRKRILKDVETEARAQIELMKSKNLPITHIDSHDHTHIFPPILDIVIKLAREYKIPRIRYPYQAVLNIASQYRQRVKAYCISALARCSRGKFGKNGINFYPNFWGLSESGNLNENSLMKILKILPDGYNEIVCHPGFADDELRRVFPAAYNWEEEVRALTSSRVKIFLKGCGVELI